MAPAVVVDGSVQGRATPETVDVILEGLGS
jgi:NADH:ubiquinone oxidoreductase subunit E